MRFQKFRKNLHKSLYNKELEDMYMDAANVLRLDRNSGEGRIAASIPGRSFAILFVLFLFIACVYGGRIFFLQVVHGEYYAERGEVNRFEETILFPVRGDITDRNGVPLAWSEPVETFEIPASRHYTPEEGFAHVVGYASAPRKDASGFYYSAEYEAKAGTELGLDERLGGERGRKLLEASATNKVVSEFTVKEPDSGEAAVLSIDSRVQNALYTAMKETAEAVDFRGGSAMMMDLDTGELIALTNYPEYNIEAFATGENAEVIEETLEDERTPLLNRAVHGRFTPGSIVKLFVAFAALNEGIVSPEKEFESTGTLRVENPYDPTRPTLFKDWRAHGWVDMSDALAVSSNIYFYIVGGGYGNQKGVGITQIERYVNSFGIGKPLSLKAIAPGDTSIVPNPEWKAEHFNGEPWRLGDTYNTAIGQYGFQVVPLEMLRAVSAIATEGKLVEPRLVHEEIAAKTSEVDIKIRPDVYEEIKSGMRQAVLEGTARAVNLPDVEFAAKTGTAEVDASKNYVNSWIVGFYPYKNPKYAFTVLMENGPYSNLVGASSVMRKALDMIRYEAPEYLFFGK